MSERQLQEIQRSGPTWKFFDARLIPEVLQTPTAVFEDLKREDFSNAFCYCGVPSRRWKSATIELPFPPDRIMLVYVVRTEARGMLVLDWDLRKRDATDGRFPENWHRDFGRRLWPTI